MATTTYSSTTTGNLQYAVWKILCRVPKLGHTTNLTFAVCQKKEHTANNWHTANIFFAECQDKKHTAKSQRTANVFFCRVLPNKAHGKGLAHGKKAFFAVCLAYYTRQSFGTQRNYEKNRIRLPIFLCYTYIVYCTPR